MGRAFFERLTDRSNNKLIDFENFNNNSFHVVTELTCQNGDEEFRPDITLLINGMPLVFIEVKKPNNREGIGDDYNSRVLFGEYIHKYYYDASIADGYTGRL